MALESGDKSYTHDPNGNLTGDSEGAVYEYDTERRLIKASKADGTVVDHVYDFDGNRVRTTTTRPGQLPEIVDFLVDTDGDVSHVVAETDGTTGALLSSYTRGTNGELLSVLRPHGSGGFVSRYVHSDAQGSVRRLTDESGLVTDGFSYTASGEQLSHTGSDQLTYAFAGEPLDLSTGLQYHRARWMEPRTARFLTADAFRGLPREPITMHRYLYGGADPVNKTDPTGDLFDSGSQLGALRVQNQLQINAITAARPALAVSKSLATVVLATTIGAAVVPGPLGVLREIKERGVPTQLHAFGNLTQPRGPRPSDFNLPDESGTVGPETPPLPKGASTFGNPFVAPLSGHYHTIPRGILVPPGLGVAADGPEFVPGSTHFPTHHTIYPVSPMPFQVFRDKFFELPWTYAGRKP
jgi:RHS repeat-associated protein